MWKSRLLAVAWILTLPACASLMENEATKRRRAEAEQQRQEEESFERAKAELTPGKSADWVRGYWGAPESVDLQDGTYYWHYKNHRDPRVFQIKDDKVVGWEVDREEIQSREAAKRARNQSPMQIIRSMQNRQTNCTTYKQNGTTYTTCQ